MTDPQLPLGFDAVDLPLDRVEKPKRRAKTQSMSPEPMTPEAMAVALERHPDYRVLRRLVPVRHFERQAQGPVLRVLVIDTETTGLDPARDKIIELAMLLVNVDSATGLPLGEVECFDALEDPGMPISKEIQAITGISNDMVQGKRLDDQLVVSMLARADLVIAHNAAFDRPFCEARIPQFAQLPWGCSFADIDWKQEGFGSAKLEQLALARGWFYDAHRAEVDCQALLAVLSEPLPVAGQTGLALIISASRRPSYRVQATGAPFEAKEVLKKRAYRWNAEQKVWHISLASAEQLALELEWLRSSVYGNRAARVLVEKLDATVKYAIRAGELSSQSL